MFNRIIKGAVVAALLIVGGAGGLAATAAGSAPAAAQTIEFRFGHGPIVRHRHGPPRYGRDFCDPRHAVGKARRMGVHRAHVVRHARNRVAVRGFRYGHRVRVVFANERGCPVIAYR